MTSWPGADIAGPPGVRWRSRSPWWRPAAPGARRGGLTGYEVGGAGVVPLVQGHSRNDYAQPRPLGEARGCGYPSIEVDVVLFGPRLLVGHDPIHALLRGATLDALYLQPLTRWVRANGGHVFGPGDGPLTLLAEVNPPLRPRGRRWRRHSRVTGTC